MAEFRSSEGNFLRQSKSPRRPVLQSDVLALARWALVGVWASGALGVIGSFVLMFTQEEGNSHHEGTHPYVALGMTSLLGAILTTLLLATILQFIRWRVEKD